MAAGVRPAPAPDQPGPHHQHHQGIAPSREQGLTLHRLPQHPAKHCGILSKALLEPGFCRSGTHGFQAMEAIPHRALDGAIELALEAPQLPAAGSLQQGRGRRGRQGQQQGHSGLAAHYHHTSAIEPQGQEGLQGPHALIKREHRTAVIRHQQTQQLSPPQHQAHQCRQASPWK